MDKRPSAVDLFAGAGGMSLGFEQAGFEIAAAVELDPIHAGVHHFNFPETPVLARSVVGLSGKQLRELTGLEDRPIDTVFGGPPCQGFSLIGQRMLDDSRNQLVKEFVRIVSELEAKTFVFENVKGLTIGKHRRFLESLINEFDDAGYNVRVPWFVLNAINFQVPQDRERLFLLGAKKGHRIPDYPEPISFPNRDLFEGWDKPRTPTCGEALSDLPDAESYEELKSSDSVLVKPQKASNPYALYCRCETENAWGFGFRRNWKPGVLTSSMRTVHTDISRRRFLATKPGEIEPISRFFKLDPNGFCNTLRAGTDSARGAFTSPRPIHFTYARCITVREMARLHGYPDWFRFHSTKWHGARQVGNSVPPPLAKAVAGKVMESLGLVPKRPEKILELGDPNLLNMTMSEAAKRWGVSVPIARRDKKNGLKKRKQSEMADSIISRGR